MNLIGSPVVVHFTNNKQPLALALKGKIVLITFGQKKSTEIVDFKFAAITVSTKTVLHYKGYSPSFSAQD